MRQMRVGASERPDFIIPRLRYAYLGERGMVRWPAAVHDTLAPKHPIHSPRNGMAGADATVIYSRKTKKRRLSDPTVAILNRSARFYFT